MHDFPELMTHDEFEHSCSPNLYWRATNGKTRFEVLDGNHSSPLHVMMTFYAI